MAVPFMDIKKSLEEDQHSRNMLNLVQSRGYLRGSYLELKGGSKT